MRFLFVCFLCFVYFVQLLVILLLLEFNLKQLKTKEVLEVRWRWKGEGDSW